MPDFVPGLELAQAFYDQVVADLVGDVPHSAALLGTGSDVLGLDSVRSTDHGWGPRLQVFVDAESESDVRDRVERGLPDEFRGWPTRFGWDDVPVAHHVSVLPLARWAHERLGFDPREGVELASWLGTPQQALLEVTRGAVFRDDLGELRAIRDALAWYPDDIWLWLLACQWRRIAQEEPFLGRTAEVGDELGARLIASRLVRDVVRLCFLLERQYAPYGKWLGTAFRRLDAHGRIGESLERVLTAGDHSEREDALVRALETAASLHNSLGITSRVDESVGLFYDRPYRVLGADRFVAACLERVHDSKLMALPLVGGIDQLIDTADVLGEPPVFTRIGLYERWLG